MRSIFISYRREDAEGEAGRLFDDLTDRFGEGSVFLDVAAIEVGRDFRKAIDESVSGCGVLLALMGKGWLDAKDPDGHLRLYDPFDFVRLETASALKREIPVIPVLVQGAKMPRAEQLPADLKELVYRNGVELTHVRWRSDLELLIKALSPHVAPQEEPRGNANAAKEKPRGGRFRWVIPAVALGVLALAAGAYLGWPTRNAAPDQTTNKAPVVVEVPVVTGKTLDAAEAALRGLDLAVGNISRAPNASVATNTVIDEFPKPGKRVDPGTAIDLVVADAVSKPTPPTMNPAPSPQPTAKPLVQPDAKPVVRASVPNFAGTWKMYAATLNGNPEDVSRATAFLITQHGEAVRLTQRETNVTGAGTLTYQRFYAADKNGGHEVTTRDQADLVDTITWRVAGSELEREIMHDARAKFRGNPPGKYVEIQRYRQVDSSELIGKAGSAPSTATPAPAAKPQPQPSWPNFGGTWQLFNATINGAPNKNYESTLPKTVAITQSGGRIRLFGRDLNITDKGTVGYQFYAQNGKSGNAAVTANQADMVGTAVWGVQGTTLVGMVLYDYKRFYQGRPAGSKDLGIAKYRRIGQ